jgi:hypothetical protein
VRSARWQAVLVLCAAAALSLRLLRFADAVAVDVFYWDQWDYLQPFFDGEGLLARFLRQHGPHRQGLGALVLSALYPLTAWNERANILFIAATFCAATALALVVKVRLFGPLRWTDLAIPLLFTTLHQWETLALTANPSHGALPVLLVVGFCFALTLQRPRARFGLAALSAGLAVFTGFALFLGPVALVVLAVSGLKTTDRAERLAALAAFLGVLAALALFFVDYRFQPAVACFSFPDAHPANYGRFVALLVLERLRLPDALVLGPLGWAAPLLLAGLTALAGVQALRSRHEGDVAQSRGQRSPDLRRASARALVPATLLGFTLLFAANAAVGRVCLGVEAALASRYVPYLSLGWWGALLLCAPALEKLPRWASTAAALALLAALLRGEGLSLEDARRAAEGKRAWVACYLKQHALAACDAQTQPVYPAAEATGLQGKLDFLEERHLSFFAKR